MSTHPPQSKIFNDHLNTKSKLPIVPTCLSPASQHKVDQRLQHQENIKKMQDKSTFVRGVDMPQLQSWVYETANTKLTLAEKLEKSKWEAGNYDG